MCISIHSIAPRAAKGKTLLVDVTTIRCSKFLDITHDLMDIMFMLGPLMSQDPILLAKVVRIGRAFFKDYYSTASNTLQQDSSTVVRVVCVHVCVVHACVYVHVLSDCMSIQVQGA